VFRQVSMQSQGDKRNFSLFTAESKSVGRILFLIFLYYSSNSEGGRWSSGKYVGTTCLRAADSSPAPPAVWVFRRLIWRTESLDRGLILVCRFSFVSSRECTPVAAQTRSCLQGWMHVRNPLLLPNG
jgi:hypothetical protein